MSNFRLNDVTIKGDNTHIGNKYVSYGDFLQLNPDLDELEKSIVKTVYDLFEDDDYRVQFLSSFEKIRRDDTEEPSESEISLWVRLKDKLIDKGLDEGIEAVKSFLYKNSPMLSQIIYNASEDGAV